MLLYQILKYAVYACKNIKKSDKNNILKISAVKWNDKFELTDGSYFVWDAQDYWEYILKKHGQKTDNASMKIYLNKAENRITFRIKTGYYLELFTLEIPERMKLLGSTKNKTAKDKNCENIPHLEIT